MYDDVKGKKDNERKRKKGRRAWEINRNIERERVINKSEQIKFEGWDGMGYDGMGWGLLQKIERKNECMLS